MLLVTRKQAHLGHDVAPPYACTSFCSSWPKWEMPPGESLFEARKMPLDSCVDAHGEEMVKSGLFIGERSG